MHQTWKVMWGEDNEKHVKTVGDLDELLDHISQTYTGPHSTLVEIESPVSGDSLSLGIGKNLSILTFISGSGDPPYLISVGNKSITGSIVFRYRSHWSEFPLQNAIPIAQARAAVRRFYEIGYLPDNIIWEES